MVTENGNTWQPFYMMLGQKRVKRDIRLSNSTVILLFLCCHGVYERKELAFVLCLPSIELPYNDTQVVSRADSGL